MVNFSLLNHTQIQSLNQATSFKLNQTPLYENITSPKPHHQFSRTRISLATLIFLSLGGSLHLFNSAVAAPTSEISVDTLYNRGISLPKGGKGEKASKDDPDFPGSGGASGGSGAATPAASFGGLASGADKSTKEKGTLEQNMPSAHVETVDAPPLSGDFGRGNSEYLAGIVDATKNWKLTELYDMSKGDGEEFFKYAVSSKERAIIVRNARSEIADDPVADAARTFKTRDIIMDAWMKEAGSTGAQVSSLRYVIRDDIVTTDSQQVIEQAFKIASRDGGAKAEFTWNVQADKAAFDLLTTKNVHGNGVTKMVALNHVDLADMQIIKVTAWTPASKPSTYYALVFELGYP